MAALLMAGCHRLPAPPTTEPLETGNVQAYPSEVFVGDLKRLEPHLNMSTGAVRITVPSPSVVLIELEKWQDGKSYQMGSSAFRCDKGPANVSVSIVEVESQPIAATYRITAALMDRGSYREKQTLPDEGLAHHEKKIEAPIPLEEGRTAPVWALLAYPMKFGAMMPNFDNKTFAESAKGAKWAIVLKVGWRKEVGP